MLFEGGSEALIALNRELAEAYGSILSVKAFTPVGLRRGQGYQLVRLLEKTSVPTNTAAASNNASLMSIA